MKSYRASTTISASPERIWPILTDVAHYPDWDSGVVSVEGTVAPGAKLKLVSSVNPGRAFPIKVTELEPPTRMVWTGGMPLGLLRGVRTYTLSPAADGSTEFVMHEQFSGPLLGLIGRSMPDLAPSFRQFASGLKQRAESAAA